MVESAYPFDTGPGANVLESEWQKMARQWLTTGVIEGFREGLAVTANGAARQVTVETGAAWVEGFWYDTDADVVLAIGAADASNPRLDTVVVRLDRAANTTVLAVKQGVAAASPVAPALTQTDVLWELPLANVTVPAAAGVIVAGNVTDRRVFTGNVSQAGGGVITASAPASTPLAVKGAAGQTANLFELRDSTGTVRAQLDASGANGSFEGVLQAGGTLAPDGAQQLRVTVTTAARKGLVVKGAAGQTANLAEFQDSAGGLLAEVSASGILRGTVVAAGNSRVIGTTFSAVARSSGEFPLVVRGAAAQTANLAEFQNSAGTALAVLSAGGALHTPGGAGISLGAAAPAAQGRPVLAMSNVASIPAIVAGAGTVYVEAGALKYRGAAGTITTLAAA